MSRTYFALGARGEIIRKVQRRLTALGFDTFGLDGIFGQHTQGAVVAFQHAQGLPAIGGLDAASWQALMGTPIPGVQDRGLQLTAAFEGHGFTLAQGNYDGAGITWGIIGFTLNSGAIARLVFDAFDTSPDLVRGAFGTQTDALLAILQEPLAAQVAWADRISTGPHKTELAEPWRTSFARFGELGQVQALQLAHLDRDYFQPAKTTATQWGLSTELGIELAFDIHVQNGGIHSEAADQIRRTLSAAPTENEMLLAIANAVADAARAPYREDVRSRKLTIATGSGVVHGQPYLLRNWGLDSVAAIL